MRGTMTTRRAFLSGAAAAAGFGASRLLLHQSGTDLQAALDADGCVDLSPGSYDVASTLEVPAGGAIIGKHRGLVTLNYTGTGAAIRNKGYNTPGFYRDILLEGFTIVGNPQASAGIDFRGVQQSVIRDVGVTDFWQNVGDGGSTNAVAMNFTTFSDPDNQACTHISIYDPVISDCWHGLKFTKDPSDSGTDGANHCRIYGGRITGYAGVGVNINHGENTRLYGVDCSSSVWGPTIGVRVNDSVCLLDGIRTDTGTGVGNPPPGSVGIRLTSAAGAACIANHAGNGPAEMLDVPAGWQEGTNYYVFGRNL